MAVASDCHLQQKRDTSIILEHFHPNNMTRFRKKKKHALQICERTYQLKKFRRENKLLARQKSLRSGVKVTSIVSYNYFTVV